MLVCWGGGLNKYQTGFNDEDLQLLWQALTQMFEHDRSAARGQMTTRGLYVFQHMSKLGNAPVQEIFKRIDIQRKEGVTVPRTFDDYTVNVDVASLPSGVECLRLVG